MLCHVVGRYREMVAALRDGIPVPTVRALRAQFFLCKIGGNCDGVGLPNTLPPLSWRG